MIQDSEFKFGNYQQRFDEYENKIATDIRDRFAKILAVVEQVRKTTEEEGQPGNVFKRIENIETRLNVIARK